MANQNKNYLFRRIQKAMKNYQGAELQQKQASWVLKNTDQIFELSGKYPNTKVSYKVQLDGSWRRTDKV